MPVGITKCFPDMSDGTCGYNLIDELFIIENYTLCKNYAFSVISSHFTSKMNMALDSPYVKPCKTTFHSSLYLV